MEDPRSCALPAPTLAATGGLSTSRPRSAAEAGTRRQEHLNDGCGFGAAPENPGR